jgi:hypothetical protein
MMLPAAGVVVASVVSVEAMKNLSCGTLDGEDGSGIE